MSTQQGGSKANDGPKLIDVLQVIFDGVLTVAACVGIWFGLRQLCAIEEQIELAKGANEVAARAAEATEKSNDIAMDNAQIQLRAYVGIESATFLPVPNSTNWNLTLRVKNYGLTPANHACTYVDFGYLDAPFKAKPIGGTRIDLAPQSIVNLAPSLGTTVEVKISIDKEQLEKLLTPKLQLQIAGWTMFDDIFGRHWVRNFNIRWGGKAGPKLLYATTGNDEEEYKEPPSGGPVPSDGPDPVVPSQ